MEKRIPLISIELNFEISACLVKEAANELEKLGFKCQIYNIYDSDKRNNLTFGMLDRIQSYYLEEVFEIFFSKLNKEQISCIKKYSEMKDVKTSIAITVIHYDDFPALVISNEVVSKLSYWNSSIDIDIY